MIIHKIEGYIQSIYLIEESNVFLLLDSGTTVDLEVVKSFIEEKLERSFDDLKLVLATHAHPDHMGGLSRYKDEFNIQIAGPEGLSEHYMGVKGYITYLTDILLTHLVAFNKKKKIKNIGFKTKVKLDYVLKDGDEIPGFSNWIALECPGHTKIDLSIYNKKMNLAYVADNLVGSSRNIFKPYPILVPQKYIQSLKRYIDLGIETFLIAHYGEVKISKEQIEKVIDSVSLRPRRHITTLPKILLKLFKSLLK